MNRLNNKQVWFAGGAVAAVVLIALSWLMLIGPQLSGASSARAATADAESSNDRLRASIATLKKQNENLSTLTGTLATALAQMPTDTALPAFNRQVSEQAASSGVQVTSLTVADPTAGGGQNTAAVAAGQVLQIPVTLITAGPVDGQVAFLKALQYGGPRRVLVTGVSVQNAAPSATMTTQATLFFTVEPASAQAELQRLLAGDVSR